MERETRNVARRSRRAEASSIAPGAPPLARAVLRTLRDPVIGILLLAAIFDGLSDNAIHALLLGCVSVALVRDAVVRGRDATQDQTTHRRVGLTGISRRGIAGLSVLAAAFAILVGGFARYSWPLTVVVVLPATAGLLLSWRAPADGASAPGRIDPAGSLLWLGVFLSLALWELTSLLLQPSLTTDSYQHPTLSVLSDPFLATHVGRTIGLFLWLALGWSLIRRIPASER